MAAAAKKIRIKFSSSFLFPITAVSVDLLMLYNEYNSMIIYLVCRLILKMKLFRMKEWWASECDGIRRHRRRKRWIVRRVGGSALTFFCMKIEFGWWEITDKSVDFSAFFWYVSLSALLLNNSLCKGVATRNEGFASKNDQ